MPDLFVPTLAEQIAEVERELRARQNVYPRLISTGKLTEKKAERQTSLMRAALATLKHLEKLGNR